MQKCPTYFNDVFLKAVHTTTAEQIPTVPKRSGKPWLTSEAFTIIQQRVQARKRREYEEETRLTGVLKRQIKIDKTAWLTKLAGSGSWDDLRTLRKPRRPQQGRLKNDVAVLVDSDERADTLATYLQNVQCHWYHREGSGMPLEDLQNVHNTLYPH